MFNFIERFFVVNESQIEVLLVFNCSFEYHFQDNNYVSGALIFIKLCWLSRISNSSLSLIFCRNNIDNTLRLWLIRLMVQQFLGKFWFHRFHLQFTITDQLLPLILQGLSFRFLSNPEVFPIFIFLSV